jgi:BTB/POZ domain
MTTNDGTYVDETLSVQLWREDPTKTFSDWTIEIVSKTEADDCEAKGKAATYHVHKFFLACGLRSSDYFERLFRNKHFREAESSSSRIELHTLAADAFPLLLDYVYGHKHVLSIDCNSATALHFLGDYFEIPALRMDALQFVIKDMTLENVVTFYSHAVVLSDNVVHSTVAKFLGKNIKQNNPDTWTTLVKESTPRLWEEVSTSVDSQDKDASYALSNLICKFATCNKEKLDATSFQGLTMAHTMPHVCPRAALGLLALEDAFSTQEKPVTVSGDAGGQECSLLERCKSSLLENSAILDRLLAEEAAVRPFKKGHQYPPYLVEVLVEALAKANTTAANSKSGLEKAETDLEEAKEELGKKQALLLRQVAACARLQEYSTPRSSYIPPRTTLIQPIKRKKPQKKKKKEPIKTRKPQKKKEPIKTKKPQKKKV